MSGFGGICGEGILEGPELEGYLKDVLTPCLQEGVKAVVLGCTHFPLVKAAIGKVVGESVRIYDGGEGTARQAKMSAGCEKISVQIKKKGTSALRAVHPKKKHIMKRCIERQRILTAE